MFSLILLFTEVIARLAAAITFYSTVEQLIAKVSAIKEKGGI